VRRQSTLGESLHPQPPEELRDPFVVHPVETEMPQPWHEMNTNMPLFLADRGLLIDSALAAADLVLRPPHVLDELLESEHLLLGIGPERATDRALDVGPLGRLRARLRVQGG